MADGKEVLDGAAAHLVLRDPMGRFVAGESGNPEGRPPVSEHVKIAARAYSMQAVAMLSGVIEDREQPVAARILAARAVLSWSLGAARLVDPDQDLARMSDAELVAMAGTEDDVALHDVLTDMEDSELDC